MLVSDLAYVMSAAELRYTPPDFTGILIASLLELSAASDRAGALQCLDALHQHRKPFRMSVRRVL